MECALCKTKECYNGMKCKDINLNLKKIKRKYQDTLIFNKSNAYKHRVATEIEADCYMKCTRLEEIIKYAERMGYNRVGLAFCFGLWKEAEIVHKILSKYFKTFSVCCKLGGIDKSELNLKMLFKDARVDVMCNPIGQATVLNKKNTQLNVILGLCVGHDVLFTKYSKAPVTTFAVKDRVLAHNPLGAIYSDYYTSKFKL